MFSSDTHLPCCPLIFDGVPYTAPVSNMCRLAVLGACLPVTSSPSTSFANFVGRSTPTSTGGRHGLSSTTPLMTSAHGDCRSTPTPPATFTGSVGSYGSIDYASTAPSLGAWYLSTCDIVSSINFCRQYLSYNTTSSSSCLF